MPLKVPTISPLKYQAMLSSCCPNRLLSATADTGKFMWLKVRTLTPSRAEVLQHSSLALEGKDH